MDALVLQSDPSSATVQREESTQELPSLIKETFELSLTEERNKATGGGESGMITSGLLVDGRGSVVERPLTCEEAAVFVRVHPKTVKRMARSGELPGHFRFGRWFFYATELDYWMRTELHSSRHSCR
jgi:excisionase family DNA binding protein